MKILSNFKDYYDYLAYQYGIDDEIVFNRNRLIPLGKDDFHLGLMPGSINEDTQVPEDYVKEGYLGSSNIFYYEYASKICQFESLSITGTIYYYLYEYDKLTKKANFRMPKAKDFLNYTDWRTKNRRDFNYYYFRFLMKEWGKKTFTETPDSKRGVILPCQKGSEYGINRELHKKLKTPILWKQVELADGTTCLIMPNLSKITGFGGCCPPEKIYRDIYNFLQQIRQSPDADPPVGVDDKSKILKHGFDVKKSFRHP